MLWEKTNRFWKAGFIESLKDAWMPFGNREEKNKKTLLFAMIILILPITTGCSDEAPEVSDIEIIQQDSEVYSFDKKASASTERIAEILSDIYEEAVHTNTLGSLDMMRRMVARLGENNLFLCNWSEDDFGDLDFYDLFDRFYTMMPSQNGITTLYVDRVWIDYNSDYIFTNQIAVQPFPDGTFRYLSNTIEQKDLELPQRGK